MKTTINLYNHIGIIATSEIKINPTTLVECYLNIFDNPNSHTLVIDIENGIGKTSFIVGGSLAGEWNVVVSDDWFYPTGLDFETKEELMDYLGDCLRTELDIDEADRAWS